MFFYSIGGTSLYYFRDCEDVLRGTIPVWFFVYILLGKIYCRTFFGLLPEIVYHNWGKQAFGLVCVRQFCIRAFFRDVADATLLHVVWRFLDSRQFSSGVFARMLTNNKLVFSREEEKFYRILNNCEIQTASRFSSMMRRTSSATVIPSSLARFSSHLNWGSVKTNDVRMLMWAFLALPRLSVKEV